MARTVPVVALQNPNTLITSALWNSGPKAMGDFYVSPPMFRGRQANAQTLATGAWTAMVLDATPDIDTESGHSTTVNNTRYTCQVPGWYWVEGFADFVSITGATSRIDAALALNGTIVLGAQQSLLSAPSTTATAISASGLIQLNVLDYVEILGRQNSGASVNTYVSPSNDVCPTLNLFWVHS